jgi:RNase P subunit RPR2
MITINGVDTLTFQLKPGSTLHHSQFKVISLISSKMVVWLDTTIKATCLTILSLVLLTIKSQERLNSLMKHMESLHTIKWERKRRNLRTILQVRSRLMVQKFALLKVTIWATLSSTVRDTGMSEIKSYMMSFPRRSRNPYSQIVDIE